jgi:hypothetical protein
MCRPSGSGTLTTESMALDSVTLAASAAGMTALTSTPLQDNTA